MGATRDTQPENKDNNNPVATPPKRMARSDTPAPKHTTATPGKMACDNTAHIKHTRRTTNNPVATPPMSMAGSDKPATKYPTATPGKMACDKASPIKLRRRKIKNTPKGPAANDNATVAANARRIKPNSINGPIQKSQSAITENPLHINDGPNAGFHR